MWRAVRCLRPCDRLLSPASVMLRQLIIEANERGYSCHFSLLVEVQNDGVESYKMPEAF